MDLSYTLDDASDGDRYTGHGPDLPTAGCQSRDAHPALDGSVSTEDVIPGTYREAHSSCAWHAGNWRRLQPASSTATRLSVRMTWTLPHARGLGPWARTPTLQACATLKLNSAAVTASMRGCANHSWLMYGSLVYMLLVGSLDVSSSIASNAASTGQKLQSHRLKHESGARTGRSPHPNALTCALTLQLCSPPRGAAKK